MKEKIEWPPDSDPTFQALARATSEEDFESFAMGLTIPSASGPQPFYRCMAPFQREAFGGLSPSLHAVRDGVMPKWRRFWWERTKKAGKDSDLAVCLLWLMAYARRPMLVQVCAGKEGQAAIVKRRMKDLVYYNAWLNDYVEIQRNVIYGVGRIAEVKIETTKDSKVSQGDTPDVLILNELVHVDRWGVMKTHMNNANGVPQGIVIIATNAGIKGSPAWSWKKNAEANPDRWKVMNWKGMAPWLSEADIKEASKLDPSEFRRLFLGEWISGVGSALTDTEINRCFRVDGPLLGPEDGWVYIAALDLGVSRDHAGLVVVGINRKERRLRVARLRGWEPSLPTDDGKLEVDEKDVQTACKQLHKTFRIRWFGYDPAVGGSFMAQQLRTEGLPMREVPFAGVKHQTEMATTFVQAVKGGMLECYEDEGGRLRRDFGKFDIKRNLPVGQKLTAVSDEHGHADVGMALVMCLPQAVRMLEGHGALQPDEDVAYDDKWVDLDDKEIEELPDELRGIYDAYDEIEAGAKARDRDDPLFGLGGY